LVRHVAVAAFRIDSPSTGGRASPADYISPLCAADIISFIIAPISA
jgi:hypothetical protein